ncbi:hypothetical protein [Cupriavidus sp. TMH.W2]|uniref:hypothetical protein n=1 Tax=Cupriavidus sp. TMH.W2 TaxID=3434465 RepID=UPI003D76E2D8
MSAGHLTAQQSRWNRAVGADMARRHRKWPLGTVVHTKTPAGYLRGRIIKHWRKGEVPHGTSVEFPEAIDLGDGNGTRFCHEIPFRSLRPERARG